MPKLVLSLLLLGLSACSVPQNPDEQNNARTAGTVHGEKHPETGTISVQNEAKPESAAYQCQNDISFAVTFSGDDAEKAMISADGESYTLMRATSGSGVRYTNADSYEYWTKGKAATIILGDNRKYVCQEIE